MEKEIGNRIKKLRTDLGMKQEDLAKNLGITARAISYYETSKRLPPLDMIKKLSQFFSVPVNYLLGMEDEIINLDAFSVILNKEEKGLIDIFRKLDDDYKRIIWGEVLKCHKMQEQENSVKKKDFSKRQA